MSGTPVGFRMRAHAATVLVTALGCASHTITVIPATPPAAEEVLRTNRAADYTTVDAERYRSHVSLLAHDELGGRGTGSDGIALAGGYIAGQFAAAGLSPGGAGGTYFQEFVAKSRVRLSEETRLVITGADAVLRLRDDFVPFGFSSKGEFSGGVAFVGYGITAPDRDHDDYANIDVNGLVVLMFRREPNRWHEEGEYTTHARFDSKVLLAAQHGAVAVIIVNQDPGEDGIDGLMQFRSHREDHGLPALHLKRAVAGAMLETAGVAPLNELQQDLEEGNNVSTILPNVRVSGTIAYSADDMKARNVLGVLPGLGPNTDEYVVVGGHYDHLGVRRGDIYNGADDNASGTAGVIELAWALAATPYRNRSLLFMAFSGEEMGLLGSRHFVQAPTVDLASVIAMINMDMIGRLSPDNDTNMLSIQGLGTGDSFRDIVDRRAKEHGIQYLPDPSAKGPSDHASFYGAGIPSLFFFTGVHDDYHRPDDDTERLNIEGAVRIVKLVQSITTDLVNAPAPPQFAEVNERAHIFRGRGVVMDIVPDTDDASDEPGWRIADVLDGGSAARAGMRAGDRILSIDGLPINGFRDYRQATRDKQPGDVVEVLVRRGGEEMTLSVELAARGG